ncbi:sarcoplasmic reticulum histidine-rich calcium-binding protein-like, partial [Musca vetustissima]|uniref:sarcoplasmic reticulum histidine-rich calcium-binding protein-like n=1 Tax=Musca vetustissima TaxID=27455 RepID=UPI002AB7C134
MRRNILKKWNKLHHRKQNNDDDNNEDDEDDEYMPLAARESKQHQHHQENKDEHEEDDDEEISLAKRKIRAEEYNEESERSAILEREEHLREREYLGREVSTSEYPGSSDSRMRADRREIYAEDDVSPEQ